MSVRTDVLLWAQRVLAKGNAPAHQLLEVRDNAPADVVSEAFQKIARMAHPDLHRNGLSAEELELVTSAYSRVAGAYQELRAKRQQAAAKAAAPKEEQSSSIISQRMAAVTTGEKKSPSSDVATHSMSSKALIYYRKAELALRRGELRNSVLQIKMAIAADPSSQFLRTVLTEIEAELAKKP